VVGLNGTVTIFDLATREELCHTDVAGFHKCPIALVPFQDDYWVASSNGVYRLGGEKLDTKCHNELKGTGNALAYSLLYCPSANTMVEGHAGHLTGFNPADGKTVWSLQINDHARFLTTLEWKENVILVGAYGGLFGVDAKTGTVVWSLKAADLGVGKCTMGLCTPNHVASVFTNQPFTGEHESALAKRMVALS
jgi:outer membrane protein assembly factor BamB